MLISTKDGRKVPLGQVANLLADKGPSAIYRNDFKRTLNVTADVDKKTTNMTVVKRELTEYLDNLLNAYPGIYYSMEGEAKEQSESFHSLKVGVVFILFVIYCLLAIPFRSYLQPLIVMSVIPLGVIGAIAGHWIMGMDLSIMSLLGLLALMGVVVNDSLVLVDFINKSIAKGGDLMDAILNAGVARFRPVMLTSATTFIGLVPLLFEKSTQAQFLIPMAVSLGFGIIFATLITLILVPANYLFIEDIKRLFGIAVKAPAKVDASS
jgi:multidrug efflux pump subunit AcrB